jgi:hypothetical protein
LRAAPGSLEALDLSMRDGANVRPEEHSRLEKKLARGLEDLSYLFLSQPSDRPAEKAQDTNTSPEPMSSKPAQSRISIPLRPSSNCDRDSLIQLLKRNSALLEEGMRAIDENLPCEPYGNIDIVALDQADRLSIINIDAVQNDESLLRGIGCFDWILRNISIVRRMYAGRVMDLAAPPRLFLVAPGFSPLLQCAVQRCKSPPICCFTYRAAALAGSVGILFERV